MPTPSSRQIINIGLNPNDGTGDTLREAFEKTNNNFNTLFGVVGVTGNDYTFTGNITFSSNLSIEGFLSVSANGNAYSSGTTISDAVPLTETVTVIRNSVANSGVKLPEAVAGLVITVSNFSGNTVKVYPDAADKINLGNAGVEYSLTDTTTKTFYAVNNEDWFV